MATTHPMPALSAEQNQSAEGNSLIPNAQALMTRRSEASASAQAISQGSPVAMLPVELDVAVPVREFRVRNLLALDSGQIIETQWGHGEDVPLAAGDVQLAWSEFEVVESQLGVRVTRLA
jgi:flagellar motor switch/type III secretory pathway protein FliN